MTLALIIQFAIAALAGITGLALLARPSRVRAALGWRASDGATYALRMVGAMLTALGLFLGGFATVFHLSTR